MGARLCWLRKHVDTGGIVFNTGNVVVQVAVCGIFVTRSRHFSRSWTHLYSLLASSLQNGKVLPATGE
jgi:hypothetical protein